MKTSDRLYDLLPVIHRQRDAEQGYPLRALLRVIAEQVNVVEDDIGRLYDNWFIETCEDWVVPYIGDLIGYRPVNEAGLAGDPRDPQGRALNRVLVPRRELANTIRYRRRRGTLALLEQLANDVADWPARVVEFYSLLGWTQHVNHARLQRGRTVDLRKGDTLERLGGPFDECAHTADVRRINSARSQGRHNIPNVGLFVWRLKSQSITGAPADCLEKSDRSRFTFNILGHDTPLYTLPEPEIEPTHIASELNVPAAIRRRAFERRPPGPDGHLHGRASSDYYGAEKSVAIWIQEHPDTGEPVLVPAERIVPANLKDWHYRTKDRELIAVDPVLGRIAFHPRRLAKGARVLVRYHQGFSADMGGGEYPRTLSEPAGCRIYRVGKKYSVHPNRDQAEFHTIAEALGKWSADKNAATTAEEKEALRAAVIEIIDSGAYTETPDLELEAGESLQLRASIGARPTLRLLDHNAETPDPFYISGKRGSRVTLDGLLIAGRGVQVEGPNDAATRQADGDLCDLTIRHCTLVPGWALDCDCEPHRSTEPSLMLIDTSARVKIEHSILGPIHVTANEVKSDPLTLTLTDSIWDAMGDECFALSGADERFAHAALTIARCTVLGGVRTHEIVLAENCLFTGSVRVVRRQRGCVRFCHVPPGHCTRTPRRYECQPDLAVQAMEKKLLARATPASPLTQADLDAAIAAERERVKPRFNSTRYGTPTYCQLAERCAEELRRGADDESEMGAFHDLYQPQREANLRARLDEYTPAGAEAGIIFAT
ncbi:MAG: hypothetical protein ABIP20_02255 [Chthoniobacteraceae bacterium]